MRTIMLPFGKAGWEQRRMLLEELISSRRLPPYLFDDILILVPSSRLKRLYGALFLDALKRLHGADAFVQPEIRTLHRFLQAQFARLDGYRLIDENARLVLLEGLVKERLAGGGLFNQNPDLLAPSLSSVLAATIEQLSAARLGPHDLEQHIRGTDFSDKPQVSLLLDVYDQYQKALRDMRLTDPVGMLALLDAAFDPAWLAPFGRVVIDGIRSAEPFERSLLKKISAAADCVLVVDAPFLELPGGGQFHPLRMVAEYVAAFGVPAEQRGAAGPDDRYLASVLFSGRSFREAAEEAPRPASFRKRIGVLSAVNVREEVSLIAAEIKKSLQKGTTPDSILVAFPSLDAYGALVEEIFGDSGIPYNRALGRQLGTSPVATALISLLRSCQEDYSGPSLLRVFSSPFLKFGGNRATATALDRLLRGAKLTGGRQKLLDALRRLPRDENTSDALAPSLMDLFAALEPFSGRDTEPLSVWMERLARLTAWSGIQERVGRIRGALNVNQQAYQKLNETLSSLAQAGRLFSRYRYTFGEWLFLLRKTFMHARFQVPAEDEGGVQILGFEESLNQSWEEIYLGGLVEGKFPQRLPQNIFLPERALESIGVHTLEKARENAAYRFYRLLLSADRVILCRPENENERPAGPSPFLQELAPLMAAGLLNRGFDTSSGIQSSLKIEDSRGVPELAKAICVDARGRHRREEWLSVLSKAVPVLSSEIEAIKSAARVPGWPGAAFSGIPKRRFSVTELDVYLNCPYDYYVTRVLGIEPLEEVTDDLSPMERGSTVHSVLREFYRRWNGPVTEERRREASDLLRNLADSAFGRSADTFRNRREKAFFLSVMAGRFLDAEIPFWGRGMKPSCLEQKIEAFPLLLSDGSRAELTATIDRIDTDDNGNFIIVDYKTGRYPQPKTDIDQEIFQLPVYAVIAGRMLPDAGLKTPVGLAYYDLAGRYGAHARDMVLFNREAGPAHPSSKPRASAKSGQEFEMILERSMDRARTAVEAILAGNFPVDPADDNRCRYCANEVLCGSGQFA